MRVGILLGKDVASCCTTRQSLSSCVYKRREMIQNIEKMRHFFCHSRNQHEMVVDREQIRVRYRCYELRATSYKIWQPIMISRHGIETDYPNWLRG